MVCLPLLQHRPVLNAVQRGDFASRAVTVVNATDRSKPFGQVSESTSRESYTGLDAWQHEKLEAYASKSKKKLEVRSESQPFCRSIAIHVFVHWEVEGFLQ